MPVVFLGVETARGSGFSGELYNTWGDLFPPCFYRPHAWKKEEREDC